jgi:hypothetical protein
MPRQGEAPFAIDKGCSDEQEPGLAVHRRRSR